MTTRTVPLSKLAFNEWGEVVTVSGYLRLDSKNGVPVGEEAVTATGQYLRLIRYVRLDGWARLTLGPHSDTKDIWVAPGSTVIIEEREDDE